MLSPFGYSQRDAAALGAAQSIAGIVCGVLVGYLADRIQRFKLLFIIALVGCGVFVGVFTLTVNYPSHHWVWLVRNFYLTAFYVVAAGVCLNATVPLFYEMGVELSYPVPEGVSSGVLTLMFNIGSLSAIYVADYAPAKVVNFAVTGCFLATGACFVLLREKYKRTDIDVRYLSS
eukprot:TRINITY_DN1941_c0_g3_i1.p1 TRINITY_DN1941_c0_g3~~TRINITY_DN1941_c0_g3_i1.p1  ORF type:complete len:175 (+),score=4.42 TRINITY_DN1941_c0_g3_i1:1-525(+)